MHLFGRPSRQFPSGKRFLAHSLVACMGISQSLFGAPRSGHVAGWGAMTPPPGAGQFTKIAAGGHATLALRRDGTVAGWGDSRFGQQNMPANLSNVVDIAAAGDDYFSGHCL